MPLEGEGEVPCSAAPVFGDSDFEVDAVFAVEFAVQEDDDVCVLFDGS